MPDVAALTEAGRRAYEAADWSSALQHLDAARASGDLDVEDLALMAASEWWLGRVPDSLALSEEVFRALCSQGRFDEAATTALRLSLLWLTRGDLTLGTAWLDRARRLLADLPEATPHAYLLYLDTSMGLLEDNEVWSPVGIERLAELAQRHPDAAVEALSMVARGMAELRRGDTRRGFALLNEAMLPVLANRLSPEWAGDIYCTTIHVCHELADFRRMEDWTTATERWSRQFGNEALYKGICRVHRLELRSTRGDWAEVEALITTECDGLLGGNPWVAGEGFYQLGEIRRLRGDAAGAHEAYELARATGIDPQPGEALLALREGDPGRAWALVDGSLAERDALARVRLLRAAVEIAIAAGRNEDAGRLAAELRDAAERYGSPGFRAWADHADGMVALAREDADGALRSLRAAATAFRDDRQPYEAAQVLLHLARAHELAGRPEEAQRVRTQANESLMRLGAVQRAESPGTAAPLTVREAEVLECVAHGASNREVASRLVISEKTVGRHLANIYRKIDVTSRTAAASWWHDRVGGMPRRPLPPR